MTWRRTSGFSLFPLKRVGVRRVGEENDVGVPMRETGGRYLFVERGEENSDGVGDDICIARTELGVLKGGLASTFDGVT